MSDLIAVRGEFTAQDWQIGLFAEKDRIAKLYGEDGNICSVVSFEYKGSIERLGNHISARMSYLRGLNRSVGEIVKLKKPIGYIRAFYSIQEITEKGHEGYVDLKQMEYACCSSATRYCVLEMRNGHLPPSYKFLRGYRELESAKREIWGIVRSNNTVFGVNAMLHYYIYDLKEHKAYRILPDMQELKTTTRHSDDTQTIFPLYRYVYYGYAEPKKLN